MEQLIDVIVGRHDVADLGVDPVGLTYAAYEAEPLAVGDVVEVPANWYRPYPVEATVVRTQASDRDGPIMPIVRLVERKQS